MGSALEGAGNDRQEGDFRHRILQVNPSTTLLHLLRKHLDHADSKDADLKPKLRIRSRAASKNIGLRFEV